MLIDVLFPNRCFQCNAIIPSETLVCEGCKEHIPFAYPFNNNELKKKCEVLFPTVHTFALMKFQNKELSQKIIHHLKYGKNPEIGAILAKWTAERIDFGEEVPTLLVPIPIHPRKLKERGYNQLHIYTEKLSKILQIPYQHNVLRRNIYKKPQARNSKAEREQFRNLFSLTEKIQNQHILMIDDVFTTGNTVATAAWEILKMPKNSISLLVMGYEC